MASVHSSSLASFVLTWSIYFVSGLRLTMDVAPDHGRGRPAPAAPPLRPVLPRLHHLHSLPSLGAALLSLPVPPPYVLPALPPAPLPLSLPPPSPGSAASFAIKPGFPHAWARLFCCSSRCCVPTFWFSCWCCCCCLRSPTFWASHFTSCWFLTRRTTSWRCKPTIRSSAWPIVLLFSFSACSSPSSFGR